MKNKKIARLGEVRKNKQGLSMRIVRYINNKSVLIEFVETGEQRWVRYSQFRKGTPIADLLKYPSRTECSFKNAVWITIGIFAVVSAAIGGLIYWIVK